MLGIKGNLKELTDIEGLNIEWILKDWIYKVCKSKHENQFWQRYDKVFGNKIDNRIKPLLDRTSEKIIING